MSHYIGMSLRTRSMLLSAAIAALAALALTTSAAFGWRNEYNLGGLAANSWTTGNGVVLEGQHVQFAEHYGSGPTSFCIGPVQWNGSSWVFPYGWKCGGGTVAWEYGALNAAAGTDNPNSKEMRGISAGAS